MIDLLLRLARLYRSSALIVGMRLAGATAGLLVNLLLARLLDAEQLAVALTTVSMATVATLVLTLGVDAASVRIIARRLAVGDLAEAKGFVHFSTRLVLWIGMLWLLAFWLAALIVVEEYGSLLRDRLIFIGAVAPLLAGVRVLSMHTLADNRAVASSGPLLFVLPVLQMLGVYLASFIVTGFSVVAYFAIYAVCIAFVICLQWLAARPLTIRLSEIGPDFSNRKAWIGAGVLLAVPALFTDFGRDIVSALSVTVLTPRDVAILAIALKLTAFLRFGIVAINQVFAARLGAAIARDDDEEIGKLLAVSTLLKVAPVVLMASVLVIFGTEIMSFFSDELAGGGPVVAVLTLESLLLVLLGPSIMFISLGDEPRILIVLAGISVGLMCALTIILGPAFGAVGVAWAFSLSWGIWALLGTLHVARRQGRDVSILAALRWVMTLRH